ncbi:MAG: MaoC family dehydratase [Colwellia sp.]|nr:MaoC family dehydratase [Colwellia sp.]
MSEGFSVDEMEVGQSASMRKTVSAADVILFADITGDFNPAHFDEEYAKASMFKGLIAHGMLSAGFISATLAMKLPGPGSIYLSQNMKFKAPVRIGDTVKTTVTVTEINKTKKIVKLNTVCTVGETQVVVGDCVMMKP